MDTHPTSTSQDVGAGASSAVCQAASALPASLDLTQAPIIREQLASLLHGGDVALDAGAVERMSTPCVQVLLAAGRAAEAAQCTFQIINASSCFREAVADLGLEHQFTQWMN